MKRFYKLFGIAAIAAVIAIGLAGCSTDDGGGKTVTFTLTKVSATSFSVAVEGANWTPQDTENKFDLLDVLDLTGITVGSLTGDMMGFDVVVSGDNKTFTATLPSWVASQGMSGTIIFSSDLGSVAGESMRTDGGPTPAAGGDTTYVGKPAEGITFP
jgi:hypothetical protein